MATPIRNLGLRFELCAVAAALARASETMGCRARTIACRRPGIRGVCSGAGGRAAAFQSTGPARETMFGSDLINETQCESFSDRDGDEREPALQRRRWALPTIEPGYREGGFPACRAVRRCLTNSDTCRNSTATAPPRDKAINSISISINEFD